MARWISFIILEYNFSISSISGKNIHSHKQKLHQNTCGSSEVMSPFSEKKKKPSYLEFSRVTHEAAGFMSEILHSRCRTDRGHFWMTAMFQSMQDFQLLLYKVFLLHRGKEHSIHVRVREIPQSVKRFLGKREVLSTEPQHPHIYQVSAVA